MNTSCLERFTNGGLPAVLARRASEGWTSPRWRVGLGPLCATHTQTALTVCLLALSLGVLFLTPTHAQEGDKVITNSLNMKLAPIPAGKFLMGSPPAEEERETEETQHEVAITRPFHLGVHAVTQRQYEQVMGKNTSFFNPRSGGSLDHPVDQVLWKEAADFCERLSARATEKEAGRVYRLPSEAEWEYACRAGTTTPFHCGAALSSTQANFNGTFPYGGAAVGPYLRKTAKVGSYPANAWGLHDMHGNVWEWCNDWYDPDYYAHSPREDPKGPAKGVVLTGYGGHFLVVRGGCWLDEGRACRAARRFRLMPSDRYRWVGFRVLCEVAGK